MVFNPVSSYVPKQGSLRVVEQCFFHWINLRVNVYFIWLVFLSQEHIFGGTKEVGSGDICSCPGGICRNWGETCACVVPWKKKKPKQNMENHLKAVCVWGRHLFGQPSASSSKQLTALVKPGGKTPFFSVLPCSFAVALRMWPESLAWWCSDLPTVSLVKFFCN